MTYSILLSDGEQLGRYSTAKAPKAAAKAAVKQLYIKTGKKNGTIRFQNNKTKKEYTYKFIVDEYRNPIQKTIGKNTFYEKYRINVERV